VHVKTERRLKRLLGKAEQRVLAAELQLKQQRDTVEKRLCDGHDFERSMTRLAEIEISQHLGVKERDCLRDALAAKGTAGRSVRTSAEPQLRVIARDVAHDHDTPTV
jgi:hypothetical protein